MSVSIGAAIECAAMTKVRHHLPWTAAPSLLVPLTVLVAALGLSACGPSGSSSQAPGAAVKTAIIKLLPGDASVEPPWDGRFVQVNVRVAEPGKMDPSDWAVFVDGKKPELRQPPSILAHSADEAIVAFSFQTPYGDPGAYEFLVVYEPEGGSRVQKSWEYVW